MSDQFSGQAKPAAEGGPASDSGRTDQAPSGRSDDQQSKNEAGAAQSSDATSSSSTKRSPSTSGGSGGSGSSGTGGSGTRRRRRRGGRGRGGRGSGGQGSPASKGDDHHDAAADRGLTTDDVAAVAKADASNDASNDAVTKPKIGDTRPSPTSQVGDSRPAAAAAEGGGGQTRKRRRRRRGGRGRGGGGPSGGDNAGRGSAKQQSRGPESRQPKGRGGGNGRRPAIVQDTVHGGETDVDGTAILDSLDDATLERRLGSTRKGRPAGRYLMVVHTHEDGVAQMSVLEGRNLVEHYVSRPTDDHLQIDGNIYLGRVQNVLPGMEAAFLDIGTPKNAVLYNSDVAFDPSEFGNERPKIERVLKNRQSAIVQVTKNPIGHKGARLTQEVSLAGRFVVMVPGQPSTYGISKRLPDDERKRLRKVLDKLRPTDAGLIVRTAAEGATTEELRRDMERLTSQWQRVEALAAKAKPGTLLYREPQLIVRLIREEFTKEYRGIVIDDAALYEEVRSYVAAVAPELADRVEHYDAGAEALPILEKFHLHEQLHKGLDRTVWLPSGGSLVIEHTEALTVIDVNTAKNVGRSSLEETVYRNNLEAAEVVARELRMRDIGGIIVIDFIDMENEHNRRDVENRFSEALARDKTRTQAYPISDLGLVQMTRKRVGEGLVETMSHACEECAGFGYVVDAALFE